MIPEAGHFALILALLLALAQATLPLIGAQRRNGPLMAVAGSTSAGQFVLVAIAFGCLMYAHITSDFTVRNVIENSNTAKPLLYRITGVWGNHEGSMMLWVLILSLFGACVAAFGRHLPPALKARVLAVQGMVGVAFLAYILFTSNPFARVFPPPLNGRGLNPILQDPGLAFHPPFLYLGYVGFSVAFAFAVAALIEGKVDAAWARWVRPWALAAWSFLTVGIALGSWWAYYELGWGGWWFWDPVENASFMPWLVGTALLHSAVVVEKRGALKSWTILLAILTFALSLLGTFLVRSGVLTSVHAFATDPARGLFIMVILVAAIGGSLTLYAFRAPALASTGLFRPISREGAMVFNNLLMATAAATVLLGTLYPLMLDALDLGKISVGKPYFNSTFVPLMVPVIVAMAVAPFLSWKRADLAGVMGRMKFVALATALVVAATLYFTDARALRATLGLGLATWLALGVLWELAERIKLFRVPLGDSVRRAIGLPRAAWGMSIAHGAAAIVVAGITVSSAWRVERIQFLRPGQSVSIAGYKVAFDRVDNVRGPNYLARRGRFTVTSDGRPVTVLFPAKRIYQVPPTQTTEAAIHTTLFADLYVVLGDPAKDGGWATRMYFNPLVPWIWGGAILMFLGGLVSLTDRRHRVGAPRRSAARLHPAPKPAA
jgi:cytochrome c-type biogenesis protein CcmF